ncbi:MAG: DUF1311 domain-containing protein [Sphingomonas sp.]|nr:MAG: DUF1311 domain-containing protein [Sphingomonas sp.]
MTQASLLGMMAAIAVSAVPVASSTKDMSTGSPRGAGFDCTRTTTRAERLICGDDDLTRQDRYLNTVYAGAIRSAPPTMRAALVRTQRAWLAQRDACADTACMTASYDDRTAALWRERERIDRYLRRRVSRVGQCEVTTIAQIGPRLGASGPPDQSGTSITFANGVHQVSYDLERPIARSRLKDRARVCLVSIPRHCPPGDDRGRQYAVRNLRTGEQWQLFDSQHLCGGA